MAGKGKNTKEQVSALVADFLAENGLELYNIEFKKEGQDWFLKLFIDKIQTPGEDEIYVNTDDCELVSKFVSEKLDEEDLIEQNYYLIVSSPGMDRGLFNIGHFERYIGHQADIKLYSQVDGRKKFTGALIKDVQGTDILVEDEQNKLYTLPYDKISKANLTIVF